MSNFKHVIEDIKSVFVDSYKDGVEQTTPARIIYLNPNNYDHKDEAKNIAAMRADLAKHVPGVNTPGHENYIADSDVKDLIDISKNSGPFAIRGELNGKPIGIINRQANDIDHKEELVPAITGVPLDKLKPIPGSDYIWDKAVGIHEGQHVNQPEIDPNWPPDQIAREVLAHEAGADRAALDYLRSIGREDMVQAWKDYRAIGAAHDPDHATTPFLDNNDPIVITDAQVNAARNFKGEMDQAVADKLNISKDEAAKLLKSDPEIYIGIIDEKLKEGNIGSTPETRQYIEQFAGAYRRQVIEKDLEPAPQQPKRVGPRADAGLPEGVQWQDTPGYTQWAANNIPGQEAPTELAVLEDAPAQEPAEPSAVPAIAPAADTIPAIAYGLQGDQQGIQAMVVDYGDHIGEDLSGVEVANGPQVLPNHINQQLLAAEYKGPEL